LLLIGLDSAPVFTGVTRRNDVSLAYPVIPAKAGIQVCSPYLLSLYFLPTTVHWPPFTGLKHFLYFSDRLQINPPLTSPPNRNKQNKP